MRVQNDKFLNRLDDVNDHGFPVWSGGSTHSATMFSDEFKLGYLIACDKLMLFGVRVTLLAVYRKFRR